MAASRRATASCGSAVAAAASTRAPLSRGCSLTMTGSTPWPSNNEAGPSSMGPLERFARNFHLMPKRKASKDNQTQHMDDLSSKLSSTSLAPSPVARQQPHQHQHRYYQNQNGTTIPTGSHARHYQDLHTDAGFPASSQPSRPLPRPPLLLSYERNDGHESTRPTSERLMPMPMPMPIPRSRQDRNKSQAPNQAHKVPPSIPFRNKSRFPNPWELSARQGAKPSDPSIAEQTTTTTPSKTQGKRGKRKESDAVKTSSKVGAKKKASEAIVTDPNDAPGHGQCWGIKKDGTRCTRRLGASTSSAASPLKGQSPAKKAGDVIVLDDSDASLSAEESDGETDDVRRDYCFQHAKEINRTNGFLLPQHRRRHTSPSSLSGDDASSSSSKSSIEDEAYIDFEEYLSPAQNSGRVLSDRVKARLRTAMCRSPSKVDWQRRGFIYIYELRDRSTATHLALKVGRAVNVFKRIEQWRTRCQSKDPLLRAYFPREATDSSSSGEERDGREGRNRHHRHQQGLIPGADTMTARGLLLAHKWESLCHLELADLGTRLDEGQACKDCGSRHREIFLVPRDKTLGYEGVTAIVEKWAKFVKLVERSR